MFELEPFGVLYVCPGDPLVINCSTYTELLEWNVTIPNHQGLITKSFQLGPNLLKTSVFSDILRISLIGEPSPLISTVSVENATANLNGSLIICNGLNFIDDGVALSASVRLNLVGNNGGNVNVTTTMDITEQIEASHVTVILQWSILNGVSYIVNTDPQVAVNYTGRNTARLTVFYNIIYNISIMASLCGTDRTTFSVVKYVKCPQLASDSPVRVEGDRNPALEGTSVTFSCPSELTLTGSNASTCMENGEWEPDTKESTCKVTCDTPMANNNVNLNYCNSSTLEDSLLTFQCKDGLLPDDVFMARCYRNRSWIPDPSGHACATSSAANCGEPPPPSDGYLESYTSTIEGARVNRVHVCQDGQLPAIESIVCSSDGEWATINGNICSVLDMHKSMVNLLASISGSLGALLAVVVIICGILFVVIAVISRKKGTAVSSSEEQGNGESKSKGQIPEYEEVMASRNEVPHDEPEELEMINMNKRCVNNKHNLLISDTCTDLNSMFCHWRLCVYKPQ